MTLKIITFANGPLDPFPFFTDGDDCGDGEVVRIQWAHRAISKLGKS